jgi:NAD(P)-dependent dehydrogenase (short-subunit alcohol dehydrogenase family)
VEKRIVDTPKPGQRVVLITGAGSGIGLAIARRFIAAGDRLALAWFGNCTALSALAQQAAADHVLLREVDVRDLAAVNAFVKTAEQMFGRLDVVVTSAGIAIWGPTHELPWETFEQTFAVNVRGTLACIRAALPGMYARGTGRIITISSEVALLGMAEAVAYTASKAAVIGMTKALARECAPRGVLVNSVAPGPTHTPLLDQSPEATNPAALAAMPIGRFAQPDEIAGAVEMLAGKDGSFFVGQVVSPNGGAAI